MHRRLVISFFLLSALLAARDAGDPLLWIPKRASRVVLVNRPSDTVARWDQLAARLNSKEMSLVRQALLKNFGGLPVLNPELPLVEFILPAPAPKPTGQDAKPSPKGRELAFRIVSFKSPEAFKARFKPVDMAKAAASYTAVTVGGTPMLAAVRGNLAVFAPMDQGALLKTLLAEKARYTLPPTSELAWAKAQDLAILVSIENLPREAKATPPKPGTNPVWAPLDNLAKAVREHPAKEISSLVLGLKLSESGDLLASARLGVAPGGVLARHTAGLGADANPAFRGISAAPFALAFGLAIPQAWAETMAGAAVAAAQPEPKTDPLAQAALQDLLHQLRGFSLVLCGPKPGTPMASGLGFALTVENSKTFLNAAAALAERPSKAGAAGMSVQRETFQGKPVTTFTTLPADPKEAAGSAPSPLPPPEALFGSKEIKSSLLAADEHTVVAGFGDSTDVFTAGLASLSSGGLGQLARVQRTRNLLGAGQAVLYLSLPELAQLASAFAPLPITPEDLQNPVPPIGFTLNISAARIDFAAAAPSETLGLIGRLAAAAAALRKPKAAQAEE